MHTSKQGNANKTNKTKQNKTTKLFIPPNTTLSRLHKKTHKDTRARTRKKKKHMRKKIM